MSTALLGGSLKLTDDLTLRRMGYGAMQLAGPGVWGPPRDRGEAIAVLREAVERGIAHIDTSDYYGPHIVNELIREALHPYPKDLHIVTKVGARRAPDKSWPVALSREELTSAVHDNLERLRLDVLDVVNLRVGGLDRPTPGSIADPFTVLAKLRQQGLIRHLGVSNVSAEQLTEAQSIAPVVCVQNTTTLPPGTTANSSIAAHGRPSHTPHSFPSEGLRLCSRPCSTLSPLDSAQRRGRSRLRGCCSTRPRSCSSQAPRRWRTCARISPPPRSNCLPTRSNNST
jgi:hypothetical protein